MTQIVRFHLNGSEQVLQAAPDARLSGILREGCGLTASKVGCSVGRCGSCMVLMNGEAVNACLVMAWQLDGARVVSPEGLTDCPVGQVVRQALVEEVGFQCGYCAPGITVALSSLFMAEPQADDMAIRAALEGNICRCTGYTSIMRGARRARELLNA